MPGGGGKEGDWQCGGCNNRNYAFRSFCNRCKQPRILVDVRTPADSKWLPRVGDWICTGCTNNNYASREKCKKCGQTKEIAAMPALAVPGASVHSHPSYFARAHGGGMGNLINAGSLLWPLSAFGQYGNLPTDSYGLRQASNWSWAGNGLSGITYGGETGSLSSASNGNGWRSGDWICACGFHNYTSRVQCKKCSAPKPNSMPTSLVSPTSAALGTKRLASEEFVDNWDNKRLNAGEQPFAAGLEAFAVTGRGANSSGGSAPNLVMGKGVKHWRDGDWVCSNCNNHNYASRAQCNR
ncbi:hypothetical protein M569_07541, partial [Genlisea aurea]